MKRVRIDLPAAVVVAGVVLAGASAIRAATYESTVRVVPAETIVPATLEPAQEGEPAAQPVASVRARFDGGGGVRFDLDVPAEGVPDGYLPLASVRVWQGTERYRADVPGAGPGKGDPIAASREYAELPWSARGLHGQHDTGSGAAYYWLQLELVLRPDPDAAAARAPLRVYQRLVFDLRGLEEAGTTHRLQPLAPAR